MSDLVERLRESTSWYALSAASHEAAHELVRLTAEVARLRAMLEDVVMAHDLPGDHCEMEQVVQRIRAALEATDDQG